MSAKSHSAVNVISGISVASVAVATAAIVIVLSVFNGFSSLTQSRFSIIDPELALVPASGKVFVDADSLCRQAMSVEGVRMALPVIVERGLLMTGGSQKQMGVVFKGVPEGYDDIADFDPVTYYYYPSSPERPDSLPRAMLAVGVASRLGLSPGEPVELYTLRRVGRINPSNPGSAFFSEAFGVERILAVDQPEFDTDHIIVPLDIARELLQYPSDEASAIELALDASASPQSVARKLAGMFPGAQILTRQQQHGEAYRMIAVEKWVTFAMLVFILVIAAFNIISTLSLMVIEKQSNMETLRAIGASSAQTASVFGLLGMFITALGGAAGIVLGVALSLAQQWGGFIKLGGNPSLLTVNAYPVRVEWIDIAIVIAIIFAISLLAAMAGNTIARLKFKNF